MKKCENCNSQHEGKYASGRFCSQKCSRGFSTKSKRSEINDKVSKTLISRYLEKKPLRNARILKDSRTLRTVEKVCENCNSNFEVPWGKRDQKNCSISCSAKQKWKNDEYRQMMSKYSSISAAKKHKNPDIKFGWRKRTKFKMSYPEEIAKNTLDKNGINYVYEYPFHPYFIDFAIVEHKIAIEIDGKQHDLPDRILSDRKKDEKLKENGWKVYRIKWPSDKVVYSIEKILADIPSR
jgi:very-short-patch-repair endonuclease